MHVQQCAQTDEPEVINFLLSTEIIPLCLRIMESGSELSKTVSQCVAVMLQRTLLISMLLFLSLIYAH